MVAFDCSNMHGAFVNSLFGVQNFKGTITHSYTNFILRIDTNLPNNFLIQIFLLSLFDSISDIIIENKFGISNKDNIIFHITSLLYGAKGMLVKKYNFLNLYKFMITERITTKRFY